MSIVIHIVTKNALAMHLLDKNGTSLTNGFNIIFEQGRTPEKL